MATPYVPVPMPIGNSASSFTTNRNQRSSSFGSVSTSSNSSKGQLEDSNTGNFKQTNVQDRMDSTSSVCGSPLIRTKFTGTDSSIEYSARPRDTEEQHPDTVNWEDRPSTPTILGYEVMEERAKFTVYKILVKKTPEESWVVFRRYTDFSRLNDKLKEMFPGFRLALPPKRWFKDNYNADFLEDRQLGLQAFLQNLVAHKDIANWTVSSINRSACFSACQAQFLAAVLLSMVLFLWCSVYGMYMVSSIPSHTVDRGKRNSLFKDFLVFDNIGKKILSLFMLKGEQRTFLPREKGTDKTSTRLHETLLADLYRELYEGLPETSSTQEMRHGGLNFQTSLPYTRDTVYLSDFGVLECWLGGLQH